MWWIDLTVIFWLEDIVVLKNGDFGFDTARAEFGVKAWGCQGEGGFSQRVVFNGDP